MTPICLPPFDSDEINEYDCFKPSKERPFPNMIFDGTDKICHPNSDSRLTTFEKSKYIPKENERVTNGFGPANARSPCKSNCKMEEPPQKKVCTYHSRVHTTYSYINIIIYLIYYLAFFVICLQSESLIARNTVFRKLCENL